MEILTLTRYGIEPDIVIPEESFFTLSIENKALLLTILSEMRDQIENGKEGEFHLLLADKCLKLEKSAGIIFDYTDIDFNSKSITNLMTKKFSEFLGFGEQAATLNELERLIQDLTEDFRLKSGINVQYDAVLNAINLAKICSLKVADNSLTLTERICEYVSLFCDLKQLKLFILVFGKQFLDDMEITALFQDFRHKGVRLLIIEGADKTDLRPNERRLIIDGDLCSITQGFENEEEIR
jgi:CRISPR type II-A-associated protein Csn2